ncbi:rhomboid family intramembrane serine protease [Vreelandella massiliensis]|uniref:rhomboid family intramembrane serine protease n=1 Tax=Vreelandella massiliensis TaxID=1816686 RepID=UPI00096AC625|nr:rhomboid family intramembrane serine protease [Halomonas massiliensis]
MERQDPIVRRSTPVVTQLLILNGLAFLALSTAPQLLIEHFALWPIADPAAIQLPDRLPPGEFRPWQLVSYAFMHGGFLHLAINMFVLWMFGRPIESQWGPRYFLAFYVTCIVGTGLVQLFIASSGLMPPAPTVGASGGVFAVLLAFGLRFPNQMVILLIPPIPMKAKYFVIFIGLVELMAGVFGTSPGVANFGHLAGMAFAGLFILLFRQRLNRPD